MKSYPTEALTHTPISATLELVTRHDLVPEQIREVHIRSLARAADILADPTKYDPRTKETADHSLPYVIAAAIVDRQVTPAQFSPEKINNPALRAQLSKVKVTADPEIEKVFPNLQRVHVTIVTSDDRKLSCQLDYPKGDPRNPMTDKELEAKFDSLAGPVFSPDQLATMKQKLHGLASCAKVSDLMATLVADRLPAT